MDNERQELRAKSDREIYIRDRIIADVQVAVIEAMMSNGTLQSVLNAIEDVKARWNYDSMER